MLSNTRNRILVLAGLICAFGIVAGTLLLLHPWRPSQAASKSSSSSASDERAEGCRLVVLVVFDQMRADYLDRWQKQMGDDGFRRLESEGTWFTNCHYPYACTETGPGHATLVTGRMPNSHGIVGNMWYEPPTKHDIYCVAGSSKYESVPHIAASDSVATPENLIGVTVADSLRSHKGKVVSLAGKDRSAVLMGGKHPHACYWFDSTSGQFITSTYYRRTPHPWVADFNAARPADRWFGKEWTRLRADLNYRAFTGPDVAGEDLGAGWRTFPHTLTGKQDELHTDASNKSYYEDFRASPYANELLLDLAKRAIEAEDLGAGASPDLLCVSFSATDIIGHTWGPDSQEVFDAQLRSDRIVAGLLGYLDDHIGRDHYTLVLTSDHGVCPLPEVTRARDKEFACRVSPKVLEQQANDFLQDAYAPGDHDNFVYRMENWFYLNRPSLNAHHLKLGDAEKKLADWLKDQPGILRAYTRDQLEAGVDQDDAIGQSVQRSYYSTRNGDVVAIVKPFCIFWSGKTGTTHGSPHDYDNHVPLLVFGRNVPATICTDAVTPLSVASILAAGLNIDPPQGAEADLPACLHAK